MGLTIKAPVMSERQEEEATLRLLGVLGAKTYKLSQARATQQTRGISDLLAFVPVRGSVVMVWVEQKRAKRSKTYPEQHIFRLLCKLGNIHHIHGTHRDVEAWCVQQGIVQVMPSGGYVVAPFTPLDQQLMVFGPLYESVRDSLWPVTRGRSGGVRERTPRSRGYRRSG